MRIQQPRLVVQHAGVRIFELNFGVLRRFHLRPGKHHAAFETLRKEVVMAGLTVITQDFEGEVFLVGQIDLNARKPNNVNEFR